MSGTPASNRNSKRWVKSMVPAAQATIAQAWLEQSKKIKLLLKHGLKDQARLEQSKRSSMA